jgi:hypothetical protein
VVVIVVFVAVRLLGCARGGIGFESVSGAQRFAFRARQAPILTATAGCRRLAGNSFVWRGLPQFMVRGFGEAVKPARWERVAFRTGEGTLLLRHLWFSDIRQKPRVRGAALGIVHSGLSEAQFAIYGVSDIGGVDVLLSVVFAPADRAQGESAGRFESPVFATRASKINRCRSRGEIDGFWRLPVYGRTIAKLHTSVPFRYQKARPVESGPQGESDLNVHCSFSLFSSARLDIHDDVVCSCISGCTGRIATAEGGNRRA